MEEDAASQQLSEIQFMQTMKQVAPVDQGDPHQIHIEVIQQAMQANMEDQEMILLLTGHLSLHMAMLGDGALLQQMQEQGAEVQQQGTRTYMSFPVQQPMMEQAPAEEQPPQEQPPQEGEQENEV